MPSIGRRVARLRIANGESLREAAQRTGVSHSTIARIEKGEVTASFDDTLQKVAEGYHVPLEYLLTGRQGNRSSPTAPLRRLAPDQRAVLLFTPGLDRIRRAVAMVTRQPGRLSGEHLATTLGTETESLEQALRGEAHLPDTLPQQLSYLTGIAPLWFEWSMKEGEVPRAQRGEWTAYVRLVRKISAAQLAPQLVEMAIDLLHIQANESADEASPL